MEVDKSQGVEEHDLPTFLTSMIASGSVCGPTGGSGPASFKSRHGLSLPQTLGVVASNSMSCGQLM